jgi:hypothetical protein
MIYDRQSLPSDLDSRDGSTPGTARLRPAPAHGALRQTSTQTLLGRWQSSRRPHGLPFDGVGQYRCFALQSILHKGALQLIAIAVDQSAPTVHNLSNGTQHLTIQVLPRPSAPNCAPKILYNIRNAKKIT